MKLYKKEKEVMILALALFLCIAKFAWAQPVTADINSDGVVNQRDYDIMDMQFVGGGCGDSQFCGDLNGDGKIDADDYFLIDSAFAEANQAPVLGAQEAAAEAQQNAAQNANPDEVSYSQMDADFTAGCQGNCASDLNGDGQVDADDYFLKDKSVILQNTND